MRVGWVDAGRENITVVRGSCRFWEDGGVVSTNWIGRAERVRGV